MAAPQASNTRAPLGIAGIGVAVGGRINLTNLGMLGFAAMSSGTLRELISVGLRFFSLTTLHSSIVLSERQTDCEIAIDIAAIVATVPGFVHPVLARHSHQICVDLAADEEFLRPLLNTIAIHDIKFGRGRSPHTGRLHRTVRTDPRTATPRLGLSAEVRSELLSAPGEMPDLDAVAASLHLHPRTLRRRLAEEGTSFRALVRHRPQRVPTQAALADDPDRFRGRAAEVDGGPRIVLPGVG